MPYLIDENLVNFKEKRQPVSDEKLILHPGSYVLFNVSEEDYIYTVKHYYEKHNKKGIVFNDYIESPRKSYIHFLNTTGKRILEELELDLQTCTYWSGAANTKTNTDFYYNLVNKHNLLPLKITYSNFFEYNFAKTLNCEHRPLFENTKTIKPYKFLFLAGSERLHRVWLLTNFIRHNILQNCHFSFFTDKRIITEKMDSIPADLFTYEDQQLIHNTRYTFPAYINLKGTDWSLQHQLRSSDVDNFNDTYISIIAETTYFQNEYGIENIYIDNLDYHYNFHFLTEKTYRAIALKHPFILASLPFSLAAIRDLGYKTFSPFVDESYDTITNDRERLEKILSIIKVMNDFSNSQWIDFYYNVQEIVEYNYNLMKSRGFNFAQ